LAGRMPTLPEKKSLSRGGYRNIKVALARVQSILSD
jgi:hypothetical protein